MGRSGIFASPLIIPTAWATRSQNADDVWNPQACSQQRQSRQNTQFGGKRIHIRAPYIDDFIAVPVSSHDFNDDAMRAQPSATPS